jgi:two-component system cell cycle sensor histidine kinase/response regulator CckA
MRMGDPVALALLVDELPFALWVGEVPSGEVVYTNAAFREVLGIDPPPGAARGTFVEPYGVHTLTGERYPEDQMPYERVLAARGPIVQDDLVIHRRDGRRVHLRVFAKPLFDEQGRITHVLEAFTDITREIEAERARIESERSLARSQRFDSIGQLVTGIAHDFNNLLTVTKLAVSWLHTRTMDDAQREAIQQIDAVTDSASDLIRSLVGFVRRGPQHTAPVSIEAAVKAVLEIAGRSLDPAIAVRCELDARGATVVGNISQLEQMIMNLVINAREAITGPGEVVVRTRATAASDGPVHAGGDYVVIEVADTGCGIAPAMRDRVFEPYFTTKALGSVKGTGLGLSIVHGIVEAHGGRIEIADNEPRGSRIRVLLPRSPARV